MRVLDLLRGREPIPPHVIERRLEDERQALIKARQDPDYDEAADIQSRIDRAALWVSGELIDHRL